MLARLNGNAAMRRWRWLWASLLCALALPSTALGYSTASGFAASDYATGFPSLSCCDWGPIGLAFDQSDNLYVVDNADGHLYRFAPGGGRAGDATRVTASRLSGGPAGLAIGRDGRLYLARAGAGDVVEIDPASGRIRRSVVDGIRCATGLAVDPVSGDLFVSQNLCGSTLWRISGFGQGPGTATPYVSNIRGVDGISFGDDGTLYAESGGMVERIGGTASSSPGAVTPITYIGKADGVAAGVAQPSGGPAFVVVNRNDGVVTRADLTTNPITQENIFTGGSRGDLAAVDSGGCLYITQSTSVVRIRPTDHACDLSPSTAGPPPPPGITIDVLPSGGPAGTLRRVGCVARRRLVFRIRQRGRVRLRSAAIYINGRRVKTVRGRAVTRRIVLRRIPRGRFTLKVVARTTKGKKLTTRRRYRNC
jgi:DNA-binding beta-propeller fold protein YncE